MADTRTDPKTGLTFAQASSQGISWSAPKDAQGYAITTSPPPSSGGGGTTTSPGASLIEQKTQLEKQLAGLQTQLGRATTAGIESGTIPDWVLGGQNMPAGFVWPEDTVLSASSPYKATSEINALKKQLEQTALLRQQQYDAAMKEYQTQQKGWMDKLMSQPTVTETREQLAAKYGTTEKEQELEAGIAGLEAKQKSYNEAVAQRDLQLSAERERLAPMEFITARMGRMERDANIRLNQMAADINTDVAMMEFKAGRLDKAYEFINQAVNDYTADLQWQYQYTSDFMEMNYQIIRDMKSDQQDALNKVWQLSLLELEQAREEKTQIGNMMLQYPQAGIQMTDTWEQALGKASTWGAAQPQPGTGLMSQTIGGFEILKDAAGNIVTTKSLSTGGAGGMGTGGWEVTSLTPEQSDILDRMGLEPYQQETAASIMRGESPPIPPNVARTEANLKIIGGLAALGYDNTVAYRDFTAMIGTVKNMTSAKAMELRRAILSLEGSTQQAERIYAGWQATGLPTGFSDYNKAALVASARLPGEAGVAARTLISHIEDMKAELAIVYRGGGQATDDALAQAQRSLDANWNKEQFARNIALIRENLQIRRSSILGAIGEVLEGTTYDWTIPDKELKTEYDDYLSKVGGDTTTPVIPTTEDKGLIRRFWNWLW